MGHAGSPLEAVVDYNRLETEAIGEPHFLRDLGLLESALAAPKFLWFW
jgi:hypothetical protein